MVTNPKVGDVVRCIKGDNENRGAGWRNGYIFTVTQIQSDICFGGVGTNGVYFHALEPYTKNKLIKIW